MPKATTATSKASNVVETKCLDRHKTWVKSSLKEHSFSHAFVFRHQKLNSQLIRRTPPDLFESLFCSWLSPKTLDNVLPADELFVLVKSAEIGR
jgi:hypothetical protein